MTSFIVISLGADCNGEQILGRRGSGRFDGGGGGSAEPAALRGLFTFNSDRLHAASLRVSRNALM